MPSSLHVIIPTHTPRYLDLVLVGLARQTRRADTIIVSCDTDDPAVGGLIARWAPRLGLCVDWLRRAHHGVERLCQVRNNAVRCLVDERGRSEGRLVFLDGDVLAPEMLLARHAELGAGADLVYPYRIDVDEATSRGLDPERLLSGAQTLTPSLEEMRELDRRHRRYQRHLLLRRLRLGPLHKPKLLGGHFSATLDLYLRLNGFDEIYQGWGFKDDEFAKRAARSGAGLLVAVRDIPAWHLYHPTRQIGKMRDLPTAARFRRRDLPVVAEHGVRSPLPQSPLSLTRFGPG